MKTTSDKKLIDKIPDLAGKVQEIAKRVNSKGNILNALGVTEQEMATSYSLGYQFYQQKKYDKALLIFTTLHLLQPTNNDFTKGLAATLQMSGEFQTAALQYLMGYFFHPENLEMAFLAARCMMDAGMIQAATETIDGILRDHKYEKSKENDHYESMMKSLREILKNYKTRDTSHASEKQ